MTYFGIDLGTSTCSVAFAVNSKRPNYVPQPVVVEYRIGTQLGLKSSAVPSVVARVGTGDVAVTKYGFEAEEAIARRQSRRRQLSGLFTVGQVAPEYRAGRSCDDPRDFRPIESVKTGL